MESVNPDTPLSHNTNSPATSNISIPTSTIPPVINIVDPISNDPLPPLRKSARKSTRPAWLKDFVTPIVPNSSNALTHYPLFASCNFKGIPQTHIAFLENVFATFDPTSFTQACKDEGWIQAMNAELTTLEKNITWSLATLPSGNKPITSKWVFKTKYNPHDTVERLKARLVVRGFNQQEGLDYKHTFLPVAKLETVRVLIALATAMPLSLVRHQ
ncbi:retrovirus-related pol polyprotein from transposon TNT 1-94 [Tanacetum coccineum]